MIYLDRIYFSYFNVKIPINMYLPSTAVNRVMYREAGFEENTVNFEELSLQ